MSDPKKFDYFLLRYVPNVVREEFVNIGLIMTETGGDGGGFAGVHFTQDWRRARSLGPNIDVDVLEALGREIEQRLKDAGQRALLLHGMMDSYSNTVQISPIWQCVTDDPVVELRRLATALVQGPEVDELTEEASAPRQAGRRWIRSQMVDVFQTAGVWDFMQKDMPAWPVDDKLDDFTFDFAYVTGTELKIFHAVSMVDVGLETKLFPFRVGKSRLKMPILRTETPRFTAVVEAEFDLGDKNVLTAMAFMKDEQIRVARLREVPEIAETARIELGV
jgi:hypothetical protein